MSRRGPDPVRREAALLLARWQRGRAHVERLLERREAEREHRSQALDHVARRRLRELIFGCVRLRGRYDFLIARHRKGKLQPEIRAVLWIALHELSEMRTPDHAAVDEAVRTARAIGSKPATGVVNGVLRSVLREGLRAGIPAAEEDPRSHAEIWLSHPRWLVDRWAERLGPEEMLRLCEANDRRAAVVLRAPHGRREELLERLRAFEWEAEALPLGPDAVRMIERVPVPLLLDQVGMEVDVQDEAAQLVAPLVLAEGPNRVLDLCAAPGGKSRQLADRLGDRGTVFALDASPQRARRIGPGLPVVVGDGRRPPFRGGRFDAVLVDAPCTGTGVLARRHEARWLRRPEDLRTLPVLQRELLEAALDLVRPGGIVVYATCSLEPEENEGVVDSVLAAREDVEEIGVETLAPPETVEAGRMRVWPHRHGGDGAFAARLRRKEPA